MNVFARILTFIYSISGWKSLKRLEYAYIPHRSQSYYCAGHTPFYQAYASIYAGYEAFFAYSLTRMLKTCFQYSHLYNFTNAKKRAISRYFHEKPRGLLNIKYDPHQTIHLATTPKSKGLLPQSSCAKTFFSEFKILTITFTVKLGISEI